MEYSKKVVNAIGKAYITNFLIESITETLKSDNAFYKEKNRYLLDKLVKTNVSILKNSWSVRNGDHPKLKNVEDKHKELTTYQTDDELEIIDKFCELYVKLDKNRLTDITMLMNEILEGRMVYSKMDVKSKLKDLSKIMNPIVNYEDEYFNKFI